MSSRLQFAVLFVVLVWGSAYVGIRAGLESYSPGGLALLRFLVASVAVFLIYIRREKRQTMSLRDLSLAFTTGIVGIGIYNISLNYGELIVPAGMAAADAPIARSKIQRITASAAAGRRLGSAG